MKSLKNIVGILPVLCVIDPSFAALRTTQPANTGRVSINTNGQYMSAANVAASRRLPTITSGTATSTVVSGTTAKITTETESECVEEYTDCIKANDACGSDFSECVNKDLFHGKMPMCNSILLRCPTAAVNTLFGTPSVTALGARNTSTDIFTYPLDNSLMGQAIQAGEINNRLDTGTCIKKYRSCLTRSDVCGADFELCTSDKEFRNQSIMCESTLARCQSDGKKELFGTDVVTKTSKIGGLMRDAIDNGRDLADANAVSSCYKVVDNCFLTACSANPYRCMVGVTVDLVGAAENTPAAQTGIVDKSLKTPMFMTAVMESTNRVANFDNMYTGGSSATKEPVSGSGSVTTQRDISGYIQDMCLDTIGANRACYMTTHDGKMPSTKDLNDPETRLDVFNDLYGSRISGNAGMQSRIIDIRNNFDKQAKDACATTIMNCAMRTCGNGVGSICYTCAKDGGKINVAGSGTYGGIQSGCEAIVNTDQNCIYAAAAVNGTDQFSYMYQNTDAFKTLFPNNGGDPIGVIAKLNATLAENYNDVAIEKMATSCKAVVNSCIKSMCGADYSGCYRNRTDIMSDTYEQKTNMPAGFANSMNRVNGVLDFTIIRGLCAATVENAKSCEEHLKIKAATADGATCNSPAGNSNAAADTDHQWGASVGSTWGTTARGYSGTEIENAGMVETGLCTTQTETEECNKKRLSGEPMQCGQTDSFGCVYDVPEYQTAAAYHLELATNSLFQEVLKVAEGEAQAQYNQKLTREQNKCRDLNAGGIVGKADMTSGNAYAWVKLKSSRAPKNYEIKGLKSTDFTGSSDLYGSFCRIRVSLRSDEPAIQEYLSKHPDVATTYFAAGDVFTCGSWIDSTALNQIATVAASKDVCQSLYNKNNIKGKKWSQDEIAKRCADGKLDSNQNLKAWLLSGGIGATTFLGASELIQAKATGKLGSGGNKNCTLLTTTMAVNEAIIKCAPGNATSTAVGTIKGQTIYEYRCNAAANATDDNEVIKAEIARQKSLQTQLNCSSSSSSSSSNWEPWKRGVVDAASAVGGYLTTAGTAVAIMKAQNREAFTEAQKQWMDEIGSHIQCYVGADEAGTYGDMVQITLD